ncbi:MAG: glycosyltransferase [Bacilli bacterium]
MEYFYILGLLLIIIGCILFLMMIIKNKKSSIVLSKHEGDKFAILIPARDESRVIENLLKSISSQVKNMSMVYVIVEDEKDPTCEIVKKYKANIFIRPKPIRPRKGYALDEAIKYILTNNHYDLYFILDADNTLDKNFIKEMLKSWNKGYDIAAGYRNISNPVNVISTCSELTFSMINTLFNEQKIKKNKTIIISGTGFFISGKLIEKWNGFPFNTLTEDYELTLYAAAQKIPTTYNKKAIYFDEQPTKMSVSIKQRVRWIKGFFQSRKKRLKQVKNNFGNKIGLLPYLLIISGCLVVISIDLIEICRNIIISSINYRIFVMSFFKTIVVIYVILMLFTFIVLFKEEGKLNIDQKLLSKTLLFNPIFLVSYIPCLLISLFKKEVSWERIDHKGINKIKEIKDANSK